MTSGVTAPQCGYPMAMTTSSTPTTKLPRRQTTTKDFDTLDAASNTTSHSGIWSKRHHNVGSSNTQDDKLYAYNMMTKARDSSKDFTTLGAAGQQQGLRHLVRRRDHVGGTTVKSTEGYTPTT